MISNEMKERIQKILGNLGIDSRRHIEQMVREGRVTVNGRVVTDLPVLVDPSSGEVTVDGQKVPLKARAKGKPGLDAARRVYLLMNKPKGVLTANSMQTEQRRAVDLLGGEFPSRVYPVGGMDADTRGLLLLTNDGALTNALTKTRVQPEMTYIVVCEGFVQDETLSTMTSGFWLAESDHPDRKTGGFKAKVDAVKPIKRAAAQSVLEITTRESKFRMIPRMLAKFGHKVRELTRVSYGPIKLGDLRAGGYRELTPREIGAVQRLAASGVSKSPAGRSRLRRPSRSRSPQPRQR
jgi:23S rRNA pseudouridine2605 synthase